MPVSIKKELERLTRDIKFWEEIYAKYPHCHAYKVNLDRVKAEKQEVAAKIGRKK